ncbi:HD domain-containing protein [Vagococcus sp.]|uniref:HD domain-containing protein n=1 Tax=Vagococcus sp. TaxID=1933889 RepID=UPI003F9B4F0A
MNDAEKLILIQEYVNQLFTDDKTGHNMSHIHRVVNLAKKIQNIEGGDYLIICASAYLHECFDDKIITDFTSAKKELMALFKSLLLTESQCQHILRIIEQISFSYQLDHSPVLSLEAKIVQDADRLDPLGAIGIGRTFYYGGYRGNEMHQPNSLPRESLSKEDYRRSSTVIQHFYEKLFKLKQNMQTPLGKEIAKKRTLFMREFVDTFLSEWEE